MFLLKKGHQPGVYVPLRALFLVLYMKYKKIAIWESRHVHANNKISYYEKLYKWTEVYLMSVKRKLC